MNLRATSRRYTAISIVVIPAIIAMIDHSARGMRRGCDRTLAREAHASRECTCSPFHAARVIYYAINEPCTLGSRSHSRKAARIKLKVPRRDRRYRSGVPRSREVVDARSSRAEIDAQARSRQIETVTVRKTGSGSTDLSMRDGSVAYLRRKDTG